MTKKTETWMWRAEGSVWGLTLDLQQKQLQWMDGSGCHCDDQSDLEQSANHYQENGAPAFIPLPDDIQTELDGLLATVDSADKR